MVVLIDSDRASSRALLNSSKKRVVEGLVEDPVSSLAWVTAGYTIENYVPEHILRAAINEAHPTTIGRTLPTQERWSNPLTRERLGVSPSKVAIAKRAVARWSEDWPLDLKKRMKEVLELIRTANSHM